MIGGESNNTGFCIRDNAGIEVKSNDYRAETYECTEMESPEFIAVFLAYQNDSAKIEKSLSRLTKERSEWHATEHKLINVLKKGQKITLTNIKRAPMELMNCSAHNRGLAEPDDEKLLEGIRVGEEYLRLKKN